ncbi:MAG: aminotransferase class I/II-fold pyridoxal phosphate-dependent enzyme [Ignisphaera sp.]
MRIHGGDREARIDFSSNLNPLGPPKTVLEILATCFSQRVLEKYPDYTYRDLKRSLARFYRCKEEYIVPTAGAGEAINLAVIASKARRVYVLEPSYGEYEDLSKALGLEYRPIFYRRTSDGFHIDLSDLQKPCSDRDGLIVITNPSNPLGLYIDRERLFSYLSNCSARSLVDEAYIELCSRCPIEVGGEIPKNIVVVRSLTKWLSLPGLRLGFLYTNDIDLLERVEALRQPWNVNSLAECLGKNISVYEQELKSFIQRSREYIDSERERVRKILESLGAKVFESVTNFLLIKIDGGRQIVEKLREMGLALRDCSSFRGLDSNYIRIAIRSPRENNELVEALKIVMGVG